MLIVRGQRLREVLIERSAVDQGHELHAQAHAQDRNRPLLLKCSEECDLKGLALFINQA